MVILFQTKAAGHECEKSVGGSVVKGASRFVQDEQSQITEVYLFRRWWLGVDPPMPPVIPIKNPERKKTCTFAGWREMWREMQYGEGGNMQQHQMFVLTNNHYLL